MLSRPRSLSNGEPGDVTRRDGTLGTIQREGHLDGNRGQAGTGRFLRSKLRIRSGRISNLCGDTSNPAAGHSMKHHCKSGKG